MVSAVRAERLDARDGGAGREDQRVVATGADPCAGVEAWEARRDSPRNLPECLTALGGASVITVRAPTTEPSSHLGAGRSSGRRWKRCWRASLPNLGPRFRFRLRRGGSNRLQIAMKPM